MMPQHLLQHQSPAYQQQYTRPQGQMMMMPQQPMYPQLQRPAAAVSDAITIKNLCTVDHKSVKFDPTSRMLTFVVRAQTTCTIELHSFVRCDIRSGHCMISPNRPKPPPPALPCEPGASNEFTLMIEDFGDVTEHERKYIPEYPKQFPVTIQLRYQADSESSPKSSTSATPPPSSAKGPQFNVELTVITLQPSCRVVKQILEANGNAYLMERLFGAEHTVADSDAPGDSDVAAGQVVQATATDAAADEEEATCVICLTNPKDTAAMPCRHMCVCKECASILRQQPGVAKCPICRKEVSQFVTMKS